MIKLLLIILLGVFYIGFMQPESGKPALPDISAVVAQAGDKAAAGIIEAYRNRLTNIQVEGQGTVTRILPDDNEGSRHQRFILRVYGGHTVLVAHNVDLAPRINDLKVGDTVDFHGEYEWNPKGGVLHWTHHDPRHTHTDGWLKHHGHTYQ